MDRRLFLKGAAVAAPAAAASTLAAPALAQERVEMNIVSTWPRDFPGLGLSAQRLAARIAEISGGEIIVNYFAAGEKVGAFDSFDSVANGDAQAYVGCEYYWTGKHPAFAYFTTVPFGMTASEFNAWINYGGGKELWAKLSADFGLTAMLCGNTGTQSGGWFNKEIETPDDLRGLKMRIPGFGGTVMSKLGASTVSLPGGQIYENLVSGAIDATEWVGPYNDYFMKFFEAARYYYVSGMHEPGASIALGANLPWWEGLSETHRAMISAAAEEENARQHQQAVANNGAYLSRLVTDHGVETRSFNEEVWDAFGEAAMEVLEETRDHSDMAAQITDDFLAKLREYATYLAVSETEFANQRNRVLGLG
ncbi:TRAP transporter substrate-binding protein [Rhodovulum sp. DZ06]|uniref:TRAP transporter substrate-binding protein n=1 Tax=Rhodovulum sp. DZ06 TaxID=3425126 RepID=UPI003D35946B